MAPSRAEQHELHRAIVGRSDPTATARAFEMLLEPLKVRARPIDMFPHTPHVETVALPERDPSA
jgi:hypothetical protein